VEQAEADVQVPVARDANDFLTEAVKQHPSRFGVFAALLTGIQHARLSM